MTHGLSETDRDRGDMEYHRRKDDGEGAAAISRFRFYIIQVDREANWRVVSGPYFSRRGAQPFKVRYRIRNNDRNLRQYPRTVNRWWLSERYPFTEEGEVALLEAIKETQ